MVLRYEVYPHPIFSFPGLFAFSSSLGKYQGPMPRFSLLKMLLSSYFALISSNRSAFTPNISAGVTLSPDMDELASILTVYKILSWAFVAYLPRVYPTKFDTNLSGSWPPRLNSSSNIVRIRFPHETLKSFLLGSVHCSISAPFNNLLRAGKADSVVA